MTAKRCIYDFGANNGDDIPYYLKKAEKVIAVEASPALCDEIRQRFHNEIAAGRLVVECCVLTCGETAPDVPFYIHKFSRVLGQLSEPGPSEIGNFEKVVLPSRSVLDLIAEHGEPYYIKIDVEFYDEQILRALFENNIRPLYLSAEAHDIRVFALLVSLGGYDAFKLVDGRSVSVKYANHSVASRTGPDTHSFPYHSAGPFGEDIDGDWMTANAFHRLLALEGLGWKDIHVTNEMVANPSAKARLRHYLLDEIRRRLAAKFATVLGRS